MRWTPRTECSYLAYRSSLLWVLFILVSPALSHASSDVSPADTNLEEEIIDEAGKKKPPKKPFRVRFGTNLGVSAHQFTDSRNTDGADFKTEIRRFNVYSEGSYAKWLDFKLKLNFSQEGDVELGDAWITFSPSKIKLQLGYQKVPFGLERLTSSSILSTNERSLLWTAIPSGRSTGLTLGSSSKSSSWAVTAFNATEGFINNLGGSGSNRSAISLGFRGTWAPIKNKETVLHLGVSAIRHGLGGRTVEGKFRLRPQIDGVKKYTLNTSDSLLKDPQQLGLEFFARRNSLSLQSEYVSYRLSSNDAAIGSASIDAFYVLGSWLVTGEKRRYAKGKLKRIKPRSANGAWELVARYEALTSKLTSSASYHGYVLGLNWIHSKRLSIGLNFSSGSLKNEDREMFDLDVFQSKVSLTF